MADNEYRDIKFANWNPVYQDIATEIAHIRKIGNRLFFEPATINVYYSCLINLYSTYSQGLIDPEAILEELNKVGKIIFSKKYIEASKKNSIGEYQLQIINKLLGIFTIMCRDFSDASLTPKITIKKRSDPKRAILG